MSTPNHTLTFPLPRFGLTLEMSDLQWVKSQLATTTVDDIEHFEEEFAKRFGLRKAFYVASARAGFFAILKTLGLPPKSVILLPAWTHPSMPAMVVAAGYRPRIVDVTPGTYTLSSESIPEAAWKEARVILVTHMYGCPANVPQLAAEAKRRGVIVLEDCAQGFGASIGGRWVGAAGDASFFSFALTKNFTTLSGGMVGVQSPELADRMSQIMARATIASNKALTSILIKAAAIKVATSRPGFTCCVYPPLSLGWAFSGRDMLHPAFEEAIDTRAPERMVRPAPVQAALGLRMLKLIENSNKKRHQNGVTLLQMLERKHIPCLTLPALPSYGEHIFMSFVIGWPERDHLARNLWSRKVDTSPGYLKPVNQVNVLSEIVECPFAIPVANRLANQQLHLPVYPGLTEEHLQCIADAVEWSAARCRETTTNPALYSETPTNHTTKITNSPAAPTASALTNHLPSNSAPRSDANRGVR